MSEKSELIKALHIASGDLWAGAEVQLFTLVKTLNTKPDITVEVILLNHGRLEQELEKIGVNVTVLDEEKLNGVKILFRLISALRKIKPDVIHTHRVKENILGCVAALLVGNIPTLRTAHGAPEHKPAWHQIPKRAILFVDRLCGRFLQKKIIAVSYDLAEILKKNFPENKIKVIENGVDLITISSIERSVDLDINPESSYRIGMAGRLVPVKRVDIFIKAAAELLSNHPELNISFHIFGDGPLQTELTALNLKLNTEKEVCFEGHCENIQQELADLDVLLITSDHEGLPMVLLEAMALKTPVIAHAVGGIPKVLNQGECGSLVLKHQPSAYADAIYHLIKNPEKRKKYINNAVNQVITFYSSEQNANAYHLIYKCLIQSD